MILEASARENVSKNASKNVLVQECLVGIVIQRYILKLGILTTEVSNIFFLFQYFFICVFL